MKQLLMTAKHMFFRKNCLWITFVFCLFLAMTFWIIVIPLVQENESIKEKIALTPCPDCPSYYPLDRTLQGRVLTWNGAGFQGVPDAEVIVSSSPQLISDCCWSYFPITRVTNKDGFWRSSTQVYFLITLEITVSAQECSTFDSKTDQSYSYTRQPYLGVEEGFVIFLECNP
jgi:hypothetical protein